MAKRKLLLISLLLFSVLSTNAQRWTYLRNEFIVGVGASNFLGELGGANQIGTNGFKDLEFNMTRPTVTLGYRYSFSQNIAARALFTQGWVGGNDALTSEEFRNNRNLNFKSGISELTINVEYYPFREHFEHYYRKTGIRNKQSNYFSPYITTGIGAFFFNPKGKYQGTWYKLKPLRTEGQGLDGGPKPYKRISVCIPIGLGVKYSLNQNWSIGFEMAGRKTFTDYIDDVSTTYYDPTALAQIDPMSPLLADPNLGTIPNATSPNGDGTGAQRGDVKDKDAYIFAIFSVHYRLMKYRVRLPKFLL